MNLPIGQQYDAIADWWNEYHQDSNYGVAALERALAFTDSGGHALDVGCGAGGRLIRRLEARAFQITGIDASAKMVDLARQNHPEGGFEIANIIDWDTEEKFDFILSWDCLFHLPLSEQEPVLAKLCGLLNAGGLLLYSFGDAKGQHVDDWRGQTFHYSSLGITRNLDILRASDMRLRHLELDQFPEKHVYAIARKL